MLFGELGLGGIRWTFIVWRAGVDEVEGVELSMKIGIFCPFSWSSPELLISSVGISVASWKLLSLAVLSLVSLFSSALVSLLVVSFSESLLGVGQWEAAPFNLAPRFRDPDT